MVTPELVAFIKKQLQTGKVEIELKSLLVSKGWPIEDVEEAFKAVGGVSSVSASLSQTGQQPAAPISEPRTFPQQQSVQPARPAQPLEQKPKPFGAETDDIFTEEETKQVYSQPALTRSPLKRILAIFAVLIVIALLAGTGFAAYSYFFQSPEKIVAKSMAQSSEIKSTKYSGVIDFSVQITGDPFGNIMGNDQTGNSPFSAGMNLDFSMKLDGGFDSINPEKPQGFLVFALLNKGQSDSEIQEFLGLEARYLDKVGYIVLSQVPEIMPEISALKGQWLKIDPQEIKEMAKSINLEEGQLNELNGVLDSQMLTKEKKDAINKLFGDLNILKITGKLAGEKIDGQDTYHYQYVIEKDSLKKFVLEANKITGTEISADTQEGIDKAFDSYQDITGEIWIGKKDFFVRRFTANMTIEVNEQGGQATVQAKITASASDFNKPITVEAPATSQSFAGLVQNYLGLLVGQIDCSAEPVAADRDDCYAKVATVSLDTNDCQKIIVLDKRYDCFIQVAGSKKDKTVCGLIANRSWKDECYRITAKASGDQTICQDIYYQNWKNYCLAGVLQDASYCQLIKTASVKQSCLGEIQP